MQVVVTSYRRLKYLKQCIESLRQDNVEIFIIDGGSDDETKEYIKQNANKYLFFEGNPGADHLKTEGIKLVTDAEFIVSSDDLVYPQGYSELILSQYRKLNESGLKWQFCACNMPHLEWRMSQHKDPRWWWKQVNGVEILEVGTSQVAGAIMNTEVCKSVGYFPVYGKSGQGDWAISKRLRDKGYKLCYFRTPIIDHIGKLKETDFPEYSAEFRKDEDEWITKAQYDSLRGKV